jgi:hypothetical protein
LEWIGLISAIVGAVTALGGVAITQAAERRRAQDERMWLERAQLNVDLMEWVASVKSVGDGKQPLLPSRLEARVQAFATESTRVTFERFKMSLSPFHRDDLGMDFTQYANILKESIRNDLQPRSRTVGSRSASGRNEVQRRLATWLRRPT